jgi:MFS family permease
VGRLASDPAHDGLRRLYFNALVFGGSYLWTVPLVAVLVLSDLGASAFQYGLLLGVPSLGGLLGALLVSRISARIGQRRSLLFLAQAKQQLDFSQPSRCC